MNYSFTHLYNPGEFGVSDPLLEGIFAALYSYLGTSLLIQISPGFYNPEQMATELTNRFNKSATDAINLFFSDPVNSVKYATAKSLFKEYDRFKVVYNSVQQRLWFGNTADQFELLNASSIYVKRLGVDTDCIRKEQLPEETNWGLPFYLGFTRCNAKAYSTQEYKNFFPNDPAVTRGLIPSEIGYQSLPRFYYGDAVPGSGDNGYWLVPTIPGATVYYLRAPFKISFMGPAYMYMEIDGLNCIDETSPWNVSEYTSQNNQTNGKVNASFAKIAIPTTPITQWFDVDMAPYKYWNPPAERLSKLKIKLRYHNGQPVELEQFEYSFMIELNLLRPQPQYAYNIRNAMDLSQTNTKLLP